MTAPSTLSEEKQKKWRPEGYHIERDCPSRPDDEGVAAAFILQAQTAMMQANILIAPANPTETWWTWGGEDDPLKMVAAAKERERRKAAMRDYQAAAASQQIGKPSEAALCHPEARQL